MPNDNPRVREEGVITVMDDKGQFPIAVVRKDTHNGGESILSKKPRIEKYTSKTKRGECKVDGCGKPRANGSSRCSKHIK